MAPLPITSTERWKYAYSNAYASHTVILRVVSGSPTADVDDIMQGLMSNVGPGLSESIVTGVEKAALGSSIFNPVGDSVLVGDNFGSTVANGYTNAIGVTFVGRSLDGRRSRITMFGWRLDASVFRLTVAEDPGIANMVNLLNAVATPLLTIGGLAPVWKAYADVKSNDHWVRQAR